MASSSQSSAAPAMARLLLLFIAVWAVNSHLVDGFSNLPFLKRKTAVRTATTQRSSVKLSVARPYNPPTWDELESRLLELSSADGEGEDDGQKTPLVTLYRDTNGWCPFCEKVWLALRIKGIPYEERLINLQNKPDWFVQMVPTGLVPAVMLHDDIIDDVDEGEDRPRVRPTRRLVWESLDILRALDDSFPDTERLVLDDRPEYLEAREVAGRVSSAGFQFLYGSRNQTLTREEMSERRKAFETRLDELDSFLEQSEGPFLVGQTVTGADVDIVPVLERWRYQLPITTNLNVMEGRPNIRKWFEAMDGYAPYAERVAGDEYSWTAVASTYLRLFGARSNGTISSETSEAIERADVAASALTNHFGDEAKESENKRFSREAASKLISNHDAIVADCTRTDPATQENLGRGSDPKTADLVLRAVGDALLSGTLVAPEFGSVWASSDAVLVARTVAARLCVPRDLGAPAAKALRRTLSKMAHEIEQVTAKDSSLAEVAKVSFLQEKDLNKQSSSITTVKK